MIRVLIVDDERPARDGLRLQVEGRPGFEVVGEAASGRAAVEALEQLRPDLVLLDVRMPDMNGFEVLQKIPDDRRPTVIFVTAYDQHALHAFDVHALDYVLKPVAADRLDDALERARRAHARRLASGTLEELARVLRGESPRRADDDAPDPAERALDRITVRDGKRLRVVPIQAIQWIQACGNYVTLRVGGKDYLHRASMSELERRLPSRSFARIHRSAIVNVSEVAEIHPVSHGDYEVRMRDGTELRMSRRYRDSLI